jgi:hypothetical protein
MPAKLKWLTLVGVMSLLLALLVFRIPAAGEQDFRAARYTQIVESLFVNPRIIVLEDNDNSSAPGSSQITYRKPATADEARLADWYYKNSYLKGDVQRFNEGSPEGRALFDLDHEQLAHINPSGHTFRPSLATHGRWLGKLLYAAEVRGPSLSLSSLDGSADAIEILPLAHPFVQEPQSSHAYVSLFVSSTSAALRRGSIIHFTTPAGKEVAHVWSMGDGALLRLVTPEPECLVEIRIDGRALHGTGGEVFRLGRDAVLLFENHRSRTQRSREQRSSAWIVRDSIAPDVAYDGRNGLWQRSAYDPLLPRIQGLLAEVAASSTRDVDEDVRLTLVRSAEESAGRILETALRRSGSSTAPAAITLMDGLSGALVALPSWPLAPSSAASQASQAGMAEQNQNFTRHAVGSVAKILFAPAVLDTHPGLLHLSLPKGESKEFESVVGLPLNRQVQDDAWSREGLDFATAIMLSSNRYAVTLLTLGSDDPQVRAQGSQQITAAAERYYLDGQLQQRRPADLIFDPGTPDSLSVLGLAWVERMRHLFDVNVATASGADRVSRQYIWDGLPPALQPRLRARRMLDSISPEYENLRLEGIRKREADFGSKFASLTLGAGESRWSNVELAEAVASLVQNRSVRASLIERRAGPGTLSDEGGSAFEFHALTDTVHQALADAMSGVVKGTASYLESTRVALAREACKRQEVFALFSKTGTPTLVEEHESPEAAVFNEMAKAQLFERNATGGIIYKGLATAASPEGRVLIRSDLKALRQLREQGAGPVAEHFKAYFLAPSMQVRDDLRACREEGRTTPRVLWSRVMRLVAESNEAPEYSPMKSVGPVLSSARVCTTTKSPEKKDINGRHIVMLAATYPREAIIGGRDADCLGAVPRIDVSKRPRAAVAAVVAIADPERMCKTLAVAKSLLQEPIAQRLGFAIEPQRAPDPCK